MSTKSIDTLIMYGGSFDPIHRGHIQCIEQLRPLFRHAVFKVVPSKQALLKQAHNTSAAHRLAMLKLALNHLDYVEIDTRELNSNQPSYTIHTLASLHQDYPHYRLVLVIGEDAFSQFEHWYEWRNILSFCNILVVNRYHNTLVDKNTLDIPKRIIHSPKDLGKLPTHGHVLFYTIQPFATSSSEIRQMIQTKKSILEWVPQAVADYIDVNHLYQ